MSNKKDVLILCQYFFPEFISSATLPTDVAKELVSNNYSVDVITGVPKEYSSKKQHTLKKEKKFGINIHRVKYLQLDRTKKIGRLFNFFSFFLSVLVRFYRLKNYKIVMVYSNPPVLPLIPSLFKKIYGFNIVFISFDVYPEIALATSAVKKESTIVSVMEKINCFCFKKFDKVVVLSNDMKKFIEEHRPITDEKIEVIPNWFEDNKIEKANSNAFEDFINSDHLVVSYLGNMGTAQDMQTIIDAISELKKNDKVRFVIAGHGNKKEKIKKVIKSNHLKNVKVYDFLMGTDYDYILKRSDMFLVSLEEGLEGLAVPSKMYSYMMAGKPIIAIMDPGTDIYKEVESEQYGYAIKNGDVAKLVSCIKTLESNRTKVPVMGKRVRHIFLKKYTTSVCTGMYVDLIKELIKHD